MDTRVDLPALTKAIAAAWSRETSSDPSAWTSENHAWGQCAVTALIVQDFFGGELLRARVAALSHYWNRLPSGDEIDLTRHQFAPDTVMPAPESRSRQYILSFPDTVARYGRLRAKVSQLLGAPCTSRS